MRYKNFTETHPQTIILDKEVQVLGVFSIPINEIESGTLIDDEIRVQCPLCMKIRKDSVNKIKARGHSYCGRCDGIKDIEGNRFGRLVAIELFGKETNEEGVSWVCECDCGNLSAVNVSRLISGNTRSCGCLLKEEMGEKVHQYVYNRS